MGMRHLIAGLLGAALSCGTSYAATKHKPASAKHHAAPAAAPAPAPAEPVRHKAYSIGGVVYEDLSYTDPDGTLHIWLERVEPSLDLGGQPAADSSETLGRNLDIVALQLNLTNFGMGGSSQHMAESLGSHGRTPRDQRTVPAPGAPTPGKWVDQFGREMSHEE